jgi:hypothetical protein
LYSQVTTGGWFQELRDPKGSAKLIHTMENIQWRYTSHDLGKVTIFRLSGLGLGKGLGLGLGLE